MRIRSLSHSVYQHQYHIVWRTKYRRRWIKEYVKQSLLETIYALVKKYPTLYIHAINTDVDHIHLQIEIPPDISVASVVQRFKSHTSFQLKKKFAFIRRIYLSSSIWGVGYFSSTVGLNEETIKQYIQDQGRLDKPQQTRFKFS